MNGHVSAPTPKARGDDIFTADFYADNDRKGKTAGCRSTPKSSKS